MRPRSILLFERAYVVSIALSLVSALVWYLHRPGFVFPPDAPAWLPGMIGIATIVSMLVGLAISLALFYFIARRGSDVARWILVILFAVGLVGSVRLFGNNPVQLLPSYVRLLSIVQLIVQAVCVWLLFRPDARGWFKS